MRVNDWSKNVYSYLLIIYNNIDLISRLAKNMNQFCWHHNKQKSNHCIFWGLRCKKYICGRNTKQMALASLFAFLRKHMHTKNVFRWNELSNCMYDILIMVEWSWLMLNAVYYIEFISSFGSIFWWITYQLIENFMWAGNFY